MPNDYVYQQLLPGYIRLLHVSSNGEEATHQLLTFDLSNAPPYLALSYTWDGQASEHTILCNGQNLKVTLNVLAVLPYLLRQNGEHMIWIDGVCINQADDDEKSMQVPIMNKIYARAVKVTVWLGQSSELIQKGMEEIPSLTKKLDGFDGRLGFEPEKLALQQLPACGSHEAVLAKKLDFMCGQETIAFEDLQALNEAIEKSGGERLLENRNEQGGGLSLKRISVYKKNCSEGRKADFLPSVLMGVDWLATDPRDKIYGLLGLTNDLTGRCLNIDYRNKDTAQVYLDAAKFCMETLAEPNILQCTSSFGNSETLHLPSWCPDFSTTGSQKVYTLGWWSFGFRAGFKADENPRQISFRASVSPDCKSLFVQGFHGDTVKDVKPCIWDLLYTPSKAKGTSAAAQCLSWNSACFAMTREVYGYYDKALDAHSRTLTANTLGGKRCTNDLRDVYSLMEIELASMAPEISTTPEEKVLIETMADAKVVEREEYMLNVRMKCRHRTFFSTSGGRIGIGPSQTKSGDLVYIIRNTLTPFILRPMEGKPGHFQFLGEAYVHGLMYGEAFDILNEDDLQIISLD